MAQGRLRSIVRRLKDRIALNRRAFILYSILRVLVLLTLIRCVMTQRWEGVAISILVLVLFLSPPSWRTRHASRSPAFSKQSSTRLSLPRRSSAKSITTTC